MIKLFKCTMEREALGVAILKQDFILAKNKEEAKETVLKRYNVLLCDITLEIEEVPFIQAQIVTYFETGVKASRAAVVHECSNCKRGIHIHTHVGSFCPNCGSYLAYEVMEVE